MNSFFFGDKRSKGGGTFTVLPQFKNLQGWMSLAYDMAVRLAEKVAFGLPVIEYDGCEVIDLSLWRSAKPESVRDRLRELTRM
jgi:hypothetical protein